MKNLARALCFAVLLCGMHPFTVQAADDSFLLSLSADFKPVAIGSDFATPTNGKTESPVPHDELLLYPLTGKEGAPVVAHADALVTEITLQDDHTDKKIMTVKFDDHIKVRLYYGIEPEHQVGDTISSGETIAAFSSAHGQYLVLEVLKDDQRVPVANYVSIPGN